MLGSRKSEGLWQFREIRVGLECSRIYIIGFGFDYIGLISRDSHKKIENLIISFTIEIFFQFISRYINCMWRYYFQISGQNKNRIKFNSPSCFGHKNNILTDKSVYWLRFKTRTLFANTVNGISMPQ